MQKERGKNALKRERKGHRETASMTATEITLFSHLSVFPGKEVLWHVYLKTFLQTQPRLCFSASHQDGPVTIHWFKRLNHKRTEMYIESTRPFFCHLGTWESRTGMHGHRHRAFKNDEISLFCQQKVSLEFMSPCHKPFVTNNWTFLWMSINGDSGRCIDGTDTVFDNREEDKDQRIVMRYPLTQHVRSLPFLGLSLRSGKGTSFN